MYYTRGGLVGCMVKYFDRNVGLVRCQRGGGVWVYRLGCPPGWDYLMFEFHSTWDIADMAYGYSSRRSGYHAVSVGIRVATVDVVGQ